MSFKTCTIKSHGEYLKAYADDDGIVRVFDYIAGYYTINHNLTRKQRDRVRRLTRS